MQRWKKPIMYLFNLKYISKEYFHSPKTYDQIYYQVCSTVITKAMTTDLLCFQLDLERHSLSMSYVHTFSFWLRKEALLITSKDTTYRQNIIFFFFFAMLSGLQDLSCLTRGRTRALAVKASSPNHWTAREFPIMFF